MNIFAVDADPIAAAQALPDKLVVKMALETTQILSTVSHSLGTPGPYRPTHAAHPSVKWAGSSVANWQWTLRHGLALCDEYNYRYGKTHACRTVLLDIAERAARPERGELQPFYTAMPEQYRGASPVDSYRAYLRVEKAYYAKWTRRSAPEWWVS